MSFDQMLGWAFSVMRELGWVDVIKAAGFILLAWFAYDRFVNRGG